MHASPQALNTCRFVREEVQSARFSQCETAGLGRWGVLAFVVSLRTPVLLAGVLMSTGYLCYARPYELHTDVASVEAQLLLTRALQLIETAEKQMPDESWVRAECKKLELAIVRHLGDEELLRRAMQELTELDGRLLGGRIAEALAAAACRTGRHEILEEALQWARKDIAEAVAVWQVVDELCRHNYSGWALEVLAKRREAIFRLQDPVERRDAWLVYGRQTLDAARHTRLKPELYTEAIHAFAAASSQGSTDWCWQSPDEPAALAASSGVLGRSRGRSGTPTARGFLEQVAAAARETSDPAVRGTVLAAVAEAFLESGEVEAAWELLTEAVAGTMARACPRPLRTQLERVGNSIQQAAVRRDISVASLRRLAAIGRGCAAPELRVQILATAGAALTELGEFASALACVAECAETLGSVEVDGVLGRSLVRLCRSVARVTNPGGTKVFEAGLALAQRIRMPWVRCSALHPFIEQMVRAGRVADALAIVQAAEPLVSTDNSQGAPVEYVDPYLPFQDYRALSVRPYVVTWYGWLLDAYAGQRDKPRALALLRHMQAFAEVRPSRLVTWERVVTVDSLIEAGRIAADVEYLAHASGLASRWWRDPQEAAWLAIIAVARQDAGDRAGALESLRRAARQRLATPTYDGMKGLMLIAQGFEWLKADGERDELLAECLKLAASKPPLEEEDDLYELSLCEPIASYLEWRARQQHSVGPLYLIMKLDSLGRAWSSDVRAWIAVRIARTAAMWENGKLFRLALALAADVRPPDPSLERDMGVLPRICHYAGRSGNIGVIASLENLASQQVDAEYRVQMYLQLVEGILLRVNVIRCCPMDDYTDSDLDRWKLSFTDQGVVHFMAATYDAYHRDACDDEQPAEEGDGINECNEEH